MYFLGLEFASIPIQWTAVALGLVDRVRHVQASGRMRERESRALHATIDVLERRDDLTPLERDDLHSTRVWLSAGSNAPYLMVVRVNGHAFMFAAYTMIEAIWQRVFSEPLPVTRAWRGAFQSHRHRR